ncbi:unnamed protein product, partial [Mesorhabditis belari]|uniref:Uncharacterized protein n=1 Tax=Mesorhabditis belari TaxID=2138241 RepID=A0AAF3EQL1_9BILA
MAEIHEYNGRRALLIQAVDGDEYWYYLDDPHRKSQAAGEYISSSQKCANSKGLMWDNPPGIAYNWNGIPIRTNANDDIKSYIIAIYLIV